MKIVHVVHSLAAGGMENGVVNLARGLAPEFETHIVCLTRRGEFAERLPAEQVTALGKADGFAWSAVAQLGWHLLRLRPHLVHTHNLGPLIYAALATAGGRLFPILHGEHSLLTADETAPRKLAQRARLYRACRAVHTVAPIVREQLLSLGLKPRRLEVIPNGVDATRFTPGDRTATRRALGLPEDGTFLGIVARFGAHKGHAALIEAFERLAHPSARLLIVGSGGPLEAEVRTLAANSARIHFTGYLADPLPAYRALDLLVIPSTNEGMANAALEAMACGVPVLGNIGCGHDAIITPDHDGVLADLREPAALAAQLTRLLAAPDRLAALGSAARSKVGASFSIGSMMTAYGALYRSLCGAAPALS